MFKNRLNLRNVIAIAISLAVTAVFLGCSKSLEGPENSNFYNPKDRIGLWVNTERNDTLEFVNSSELIRKGSSYTYEKYVYRIENNTLIINLPDCEVIDYEGVVYECPDTYHPIKKVEKGYVVIENMYIGTGFTDNSGTFFKK